MATIAEFTTPAHKFALAETLEHRPEIIINIDRVVAHNSTQVAPFIRVTQGEVDGLTEIFGRVAESFRIGTIPVGKKP